VGVRQATSIQSDKSTCFIFCILDSQTLRKSFHTVDWTLNVLVFYMGLKFENVDSLLDYWVHTSIPQRIHVD
jgi:isoprenylcysteine carboxyl methyltransferase (ICMT) family protein YpbQ